MDISEVLRQLDSLDYKDVEPYLIGQMQKAKAEGDNGSRITLLNEILGFCKDNSQFDKCKEYSDELLQLLEKENIKGTKAYATSLLNIANADRVSGNLERSLSLYNESMSTYEKLLAPDDFLFASIYNNMALLSQDMNDYKRAEECLKSALIIIKHHPDKIMEKAVTLSNLAQCQLRLKEYADAERNIRISMKIFMDSGEKDVHYSGALAVYAELLFLRGHYEVAAEYYQKAMDDMEKHIGKTSNYDILAQNRDRALAKAKGIDTEKAAVKKESSNTIKGLQLCRKYYEEVGAPMIHEKFAKYESRIAVGLVGEGSDCFGFDDELSMDYDWGPGFCMWVDDVTYEAIGAKLQEEYEKLPKEYMGYKRVSTGNAKNGLGVIRIREFYSKMLNLPNGIPRSEEEWLQVSENDLATTTNGQIFRDDDGVFFSLRNTLLSYFPETVYRKKLANELISMAQTGQHNFVRSLQREDKVTATMYLAEFMEHTLKALFLINRKYCPYKKWMMKGAAKLSTLPEISVILIEISNMDIKDSKVLESIEKIAKLILGELKEQGLVLGLNRQDSYNLEPYGNDILTSINYLNDENGNVSPEKIKHLQLADKLVSLEKNAFDKAQMEAGIVFDNSESFSIIRKGQYLTWTDEMLEAMIRDFDEANSKGWNMVAEKYNRMKKNTAPAEYDKVKDKLPAKDERQINIVENIVKILVGFMEDIAEKYPKSATNERAIHTSEDKEASASYETYLRGELLTYSENTLSMFGRYVLGYVQEGKNLTEEILTNTALLYGYKSLAELESKL